MEKVMDRRIFLKKLSLTSVVALAGCSVLEDVMDGGSSSSSEVATPVAQAPDNYVPACVLTPQQTEGPYYFNADQVRSDITEGRIGIPLRLVVYVVNANNLNACEALSNAVVDIWHCDAEGLYSGYGGQGDHHDIDTSGEDFMRGIQVTDTTGRVEFATVYPGWYSGRTTHIHFTIHVDSTRVATSQWYFPEDVNTQIGTLAPYNVRGQNPTTNARDGVAGSERNLDQLMFSVEPDGAGFVAYHTVGIAL
jgi:protocatechuate 3,4-dioxygenase beta subunit